MEPRTKLSKDNSASEVDETMYKSIVSSLRYLINTRPELAYSMRYVSRFMERPTEDYFLTIKRIIRYVTGTLYLGCQYLIFCVNPQGIAACPEAART
jgi:hypothetical protein